MPASLRRSRIYVRVRSPRYLPRFGPRPDHRSELQMPHPQTLVRGAPPAPPAPCFSGIPRQTAPPVFRQPPSGPLHQQPPSHLLQEAPGGSERVDRRRFIQCRHDVERGASGKYRHRGRAQDRAGGCVQDPHDPARGAVRHEKRRPESPRNRSGTPAGTGSGCVRARGRLGGPGGGLESPRPGQASPRSTGPSRLPPRHYSASFTSLRASFCASDLMTATFRPGKKRL